MPNWCTNCLTVQGEPDVVQKFREENTYVEVGPEAGMADGDTNVLPLSFEAQIPTPRDENGELIKGDGSTTMPDWYNWRVENWGTKWDLSDDTDVVFDGSGYLQYRFDTAWAPPVNWLETIVTKYPDLRFDMEYEEPGMAFAGSVTFEGGEMSDEQEWELVYDEETNTFERA